MRWPFEIAEVIEGAMQDRAIYPHNIFSLTDGERARIFARIIKLKKEPNISVQDQAELQHLESRVSNKFDITDLDALKILFHFDQSTSNRDLIGTILYEKSRSYCGDDGQCFADGGKETIAHMKDRKQREFVSYWSTYQCIQGFLKTIQDAQRLCDLPSDETFANDIEKTSPLIEAIVIAAPFLFDEMRRFADQTLKLAVNQLKGRFSILKTSKAYRPDLRIIDLVEIGTAKVRKLEIAIQSDELRRSLDSPLSRCPTTRAKSRHLLRAQSN